MSNSCYYSSLGAPFIRSRTVEVRVIPLVRIRVGTYSLQYSMTLCVFLCVAVDNERSVQSTTLTGGSSRSSAAWHCSDWVGCLGAVLFCTSGRTIFVEQGVRVDIKQ